MKSFKKYIAEFLGTLFLVFFACGVASATTVLEGNNGLFTVVVALAFGLALIASIYTIGNISGSHINPAVSLAMLIDGRIGFVDFIGYIVAQFLGAIAGAALLLIIVPKTGLGTNALQVLPEALGGGEVSIVAGIIIEILLTCLFVYTVMCTTAQKNFPGAGIVNGLVLTLVHLLGIPFTGTSVNPARTFGPALIKAFQGEMTPLSQYWIFLVAPLAGAALAALVYRLLHRECCKK